MNPLENSNQIEKNSGFVVVVVVLIWDPSLFMKKWPTNKI